MNTKQTEKTEEFGKLRSFFWPIHKEELAKFLPMGLMMFFILFNYTVLRGSKDALVMSAGGAAVIPFLKGYVVFPASILFVMIYSKLVDNMSREKIFYTIISFFLSYYTLFALFIYPNKEMLHPSQEAIENLRASYPNLQHFISIFATWSYSLYYVLAELWGSSMISLLFWQFANDITKTSEAKRFYAMFGLLANVSLIIAGLCGKWFYKLSLLWGDNSDPYFYTLTLNLSSVIVSGFVIMALYRWINTKVLTNPKFFDSSESSKKPKKKKAKLSASDSLKLLFTSKYLAMIAILVLCYGISINLIELLWKSQLKQQFPNPNDINNFMQNLFIGTGIFTMLIILFSKGIVQKFGWFRGAIATPLIILITGSLFFGFMFFGQYFDAITSGLGLSVLMMSIWIGTAQNVFSKGVKYGLFDPTKEMAYIPLDSDLKTKGKAAVDIIGARLGKASGGYISSGLMMLFAGGVNDIAGILSAFVLFFLILWIFAVKTLSKLYKQKISEQESA